LHCLFHPQQPRLFAKPLKIKAKTFSLLTSNQVFPQSTVTPKEGGGGRRKTQTLFCISMSILGVQGQLLEVSGKQTIFVSLRALIFSPI